MSFYNCMAPFLHYTPTANEDNEFYIRNLTTALNAWMNELKVAYALPKFAITGSITSPTGITTVFKGYTGLKAIDNPFTVDQVKAALWCNSPTESFPRLFNLIGEKIKFTFIEVNTYSLGIVSITKLMLNTSHFSEVGRQFIEAAHVSNMTPEMFLTLQDTYLNLALTTTPINSTILSGPCPGGVFNGSAIVKLFGI